MFTGNLNPGNKMGGSGYALYYLTRELAKLGHRVTVFKRTGNEEGVFHGVEYREYLTRRGFREEFSERAPDVLVSVSDYTPLFLGIKARVKILWMMTDFGYNKVYPDQKAYCKKVMWRTVLALAGKIISAKIDAVFALSQWQKEGFMKFMRMRDDKIKVMNLGYDEELIARKARIPHEPHRLIYASTPMRGLDVLSEYILPELKKVLPHLEVHVFSYSKQDRYANADGIVVYDWLDSDRYMTEIAKGYLMVYPNHPAGSTYAENSCIAAIEAQALGIPVVTSYRGALPETVEHDKSGYCIGGDPFSESYREEFINHTLQLLQNKDLYSKMSDRARERMHREYRWSVIAKKWSSTLAEMMKEKP